MFSPVCLHSAQSTFHFKLLFTHNLQYYHDVFSKYMIYFEYRMVNFLKEKNLEFCYVEYV